MEKLTEVLGPQLSESLAMGGYAGFVWPSFIIAAVMMSGMVFVSMRSLRKAQKSLSELQQTAAFTTHNEA